jgi:hypothetical protein
VAGSSEPRQLPVRIGYALALAAAAGAPVRVADQLMDRLAVPTRLRAPADFDDRVRRDPDAAVLSPSDTPSKITALAKAVVSSVTPASPLSRGNRSIS